MRGQGFTHEAPGTPEWYTPPEVFSALGLEFDLDPCAPALPAAAWIPAARRYSLPVDGLAQPWEGRVWLNPPYAAQTGRWVGRRVEFVPGDPAFRRRSRSGAPSCLIAFGEDCAEAVRRSGLGVCADLAGRRRLELIA